MTETIFPVCNIQEGSQTMKGQVSQQNPGMNFIVYMDQVAESYSLPFQTNDLVQWLSQTW